MGNLIDSAWIAGIKKTNEIGPDHVLELRRNVFGDGMVAVEEADTLFDLNAACTRQCAEWQEFFVEAITDFIVHQEKPAGYVSADNTDWLIGAILRDGKVDPTELELLVRVLEVAKFSTERLVSFALGQVKVAVVDAKGPLVSGGELVPGAVGEAEVNLLRRILYAFGGDGNVAITKSEAEILFEINDATAGSENHTSWNELFVKAIANFVMRASGYEAPTREEALRHEKFLDRANADISGFFSRMVSGGVRGMLASYRGSTDIDADWEARNQLSSSATRRAERIDNDEAKWLAERIGRNGRLQENERALVQFIEQSSPEVHPDLRLLLEKVA